ncbi:carbohydrate ABC transporter permease [Cohnella abietis]|uniref:ABC transporter permease n=1 Tax=Cohnella abietis TaxID=2507935 RepID=A0A3T1D666_9BACL|nr:sugar ABC transporter permease [Cohnella abietis]BBI33565.1 ABC transporter permease [Cohnella abietis]
MALKWLDKRLKWVFTLPAVLFVALMMVFPLGYTIRLSFFEWSMSAINPPKWVGLDNYKELLSGERFWHDFGITFYFTFAAVIVQMVLGVLIAVLLNRKGKGKNVAKTIFLMPMVATPIAMGMVWLLIFEPSIGVLNTILKTFGLNPLEWLGSVNQVIPSLIIIDTWQWTPMICLLLLAGLTTLPQDPYESADVDGASAWQKFIYITLPLLRPTILVALMLRMIDALKTFDIIFATTQGGPGSSSETLNIYGYILAFQNFKLGLASSLLVLFFLLVLGMTLGVIWLRKRLEVAS